MAKYKEPDRLSRESSMALAAGMSYGKWKALQSIIYLHTDNIPKDEIPNGRTRACQTCGILFSLTSRGTGVKKFCSDDCREYFYRKRAEQIRKAQNQEKHKTCPICGNVFVAKNNKKYCDIGCYSVANAERQKQCRQNKKEGTNNGNNQML